MKKIYAKTKLEPWSIIIGKKRLKWFAKIAQMESSTLVHCISHYALEELRRPTGRPLKIWLRIMKQQLKNELNMNWLKAFDVAKDKNVWKTVIEDYFV